MKTKSLLIFLVIVFGLGWLFQGLAVMGGVGEGGRKWLLVAMWTPMLAALLAGQESRRQVWQGIKRSGLKLWPVALFIGWSFTIGQQILLWATHQGYWNSDVFHLSAGGRSIDSVHHLAMMLGVGPQSFGHFALNLFLTVSIASLILMLTGAIGEEAGWRGTLQPELARRFGLFKGTLLVGLIWGFWHLPANLAGYNDAKHPLLQALLIFQIGTVAMSFALAWLVQRSGSLWPAALAHAANNVLQSGPLIVPGGWVADQLTGILAAIIVGSVAAAFLIGRKTRTGKEPVSVVAPSNAVGVSLTEHVPPRG